MRSLPKITVYSFGKPSKLWEPVLKEYQSRLSRITTFEHIILKEKGSNPQETKTLASKEIGQRLPKDSTLIVLDETGESFGSVDLAKKLESLNDKHLVLVIGSSYGLDLSTLPIYHKIRLSDLVLPHEFARVLLLEQLYRSHAILTNHPYHHS